ncbi:MAG: hypothetical protein QXR50_04660, partial [Archaeoglobaceae archaeon]
GASLSRAFPAAKVEELIVASSEEPLPALVHGFYKDYAEQTARILKAYKGLSNSHIAVNIYAREPQRKSELEQMLGGNPSDLKVKTFDDFVSLLSYTENNAEEVIAEMAMKELEELRERVSYQSKAEIEAVLKDWQNLLAKAQEIHAAILEERDLLERVTKEDANVLKTLADKLKQANSQEERTQALEALRTGLEEAEKKKE